MTSRNSNTAMMSSETNNKQQRIKNYADFKTIELKTLKFSNFFDNNLKIKKIQKIHCTVNKQITFQ